MPYFALCLGCFLFAFCLGGLFERSLWSGLTGQESVGAIQNLVEECEKNLPRHQHCTIVIKAVVADNKEWKNDDQS